MVGSDCDLLQAFSEETENTTKDLSQYSRHSVRGLNWIHPKRNYTVLSLHKPARAYTIFGAPIKLLVFTLII
jgi:hypothetical protein